MLDIAALFISSIAVAYFIIRVFVQEE